MDGWQKKGRWGFHHAITGLRSGEMKTKGLGWAEEEREPQFAEGFSKCAKKASAGASFVQSCGRQSVAGTESGVQYSYFFLVMFPFSRERDCIGEGKGKRGSCTPSGDLQCERVLARSGFAAGRSPELQLGVVMVDSWGME